MESGWRVLTVDDHGSMRSLLKKMLLQMGCFSLIDEANDGEEAWNKLRTQSFDLVIADVNMPRLGGIGLLKRCRNETDLRDLPFLMISGDALPEIVASAGEWGAYDYVVKPFSFNILKSRVVAIMDRWRSPEELLFREAERLKESGYAEEALTKVEKFEEETRGLRTRWLNLKGECLIELDRIEEAEAAVDKALQQSDHYLAAYKSSALIHQKLGNLEKAIDALTRADNLSPTSAERKLTLAKLLMKTGREDVGKSYLDKVLKMPPSEETESNRLKVAEVFPGSRQICRSRKALPARAQGQSRRIRGAQPAGYRSQTAGQIQGSRAVLSACIEEFPGKSSHSLQPGCAQRHLAEQAEGCGTPAEGPRYRSNFRTRQETARQYGAMTSGVGPDRMAAPLDPGVDRVQIQGGRPWGPNPFF